VLPFLFQKYDYSYNQMLKGIEFLGSDYEKIVELFTAQVSEKYGLSTSTTYFDCTNFYFEIDREDDFRRKGPSKENRKDPIIGLGLLLDANQIPIGMRMYPGNESEKPVLRDIIASMKNRQGIKGKTIQVADKGLNCSENIINAVSNGDGYLFSKSVKTLPEKEKVWVLLENGYQNVANPEGSLKYKWKACVDKFPYTYTDKDGKKHTVNLKEKRVVTYNPQLAKKKKFEIMKMVDKATRLSQSMAKKNEYGESSKYVTFKSTSKGEKTDDKVVTEINEAQIEKDLKLAGYNLLVTSEVNMAPKDIYSTYHNLWRIEESFRIMKSDLDARPVFLQKEDTIKGHFLICYLTVLLGRILQFKILKNKYSSSEIFNFMKEFNVVEADGKYINLATNSPFIKEFAEMTKLPLDHYILNSRKIEKVLNFRF
jgi:transposase